jgi:anti-anti-sigma regulatory factor
MAIHLSTVRLNRVITEFNEAYGESGSTQVSLLRINKILVLKVKGGLADHDSGALLAKLYPLGLYDKIACFIIELSQCQRIGEQGVGFLMCFMSYMKAKGGRNVLVRPPDGIRQAFETLNVDDVYAVQDSMEEASL